MSRLRFASASLLVVAICAGLLAPGGAGAGDRKAAAAVRTCFGERPTIVGKPGNDKELKGTNGRDVIFARGGDDFVDGRGGNDLICAGAGDDFIVGGRQNDRILGDPGDDILLGSSGDDLIYGAKGNDGMAGQAGRDLCAGGPGRDQAVKDNCERRKSAAGV